MGDLESAAAQLLPTFGDEGVSPDHLFEAMRDWVDTVAAWVNLSLTPWEEGVEGEGVFALRVARCRTAAALPGEPPLELAVRFGRHSGSVVNVELLEGQAYLLGLWDGTLPDGRRRFDEIPEALLARVREKQRQEPTRC